jgi:hypothetical protein
MQYEAGRKKAIEYMASIDSRVATTTDLCSGESSPRIDLGRIYALKFWLTDDIMHAKRKGCRTINNNQDVTF